MFHLIIASAVRHINSFLNLLFNRLVSVGAATQLNSSYWTCNAGNDGLPTLPSTAGLPVSSSNTSSTTTQLNSTGSKKSKMVGPIVGAVVGAIILCLILAYLWRRRRRDLSAHPWTGDDSSQEPASLLHRRGLSEQSSATTRTTTTNHSLVSPYSFQQSPEMRSASAIQAQASRPSKRSVTHYVAPSLGQAPPADDNLAALSDESHTTPSSHPAVGKEHVQIAPLEISDDTHIVAPDFVTSPISFAHELPAGIAIPPIPTMVTSPVRARPRFKSRNTSSSSLPHVRQQSQQSIPDPPDSPPFVEHVEQRLLELRNEAERGLAEIRAQRTGSADGSEMPPPYNFP
jgi:hypothetical protein